MKCGSSFINLILLLLMLNFPCYSLFFFLLDLRFYLLCYFPKGIKSSRQSRQPRFKVNNHVQGNFVSLGNPGLKKSLYLRYNVRRFGDYSCFSILPALCRKILATDTDKTVRVRSGSS